jgi:hypothetical protein
VKEQMMYEYRLVSYLQQYLCGRTYLLFAAIAPQQECKKKL